MKNLLKIILIAICLFPAISYASSQTNNSQTASSAATLDDLIKQVRKAALEDNKLNQKREAEFLKNREQQQVQLDELKVQLQQLEEQSQALRTQFEENEKVIAEQERLFAQESGDMNDLFAVTRQNIAQIQSLVSRSLVTAQFPDRGAFLEPLASSNKNSYSLMNLKQVWLLLLQEMNQTGKLVQFESPVITVQGEEKNRQVTRIGVFTATSEGQYLRYLTDTNQLLELAKQPSQFDQQLALKLEQANNNELLPMAVDPSKGSILSLLVQSPDLSERVQQGGVIGYLILALGAIGLLIVLYRYVWLSLVKMRMKRQLKQENASDKNPLGRLIIAAENVESSDKESLGMRLEEVINTESSRLKFGLATLTVFAAVTPLLGLLGTVTGMIETFQSISLYGTGDPKLMSSGISQALITTQLGLAVAIPILLFHSFLQGKVAYMVEIMDSRSVELYEDHHQKMEANS